MEEYHVPVLLKESVDGLNIKPDGVYVDCTFGGGGHSREILSRLTTGKLIAFDQDSDAIERNKDTKNLILVHGNFRYMRNYLKYEGFEQVDGILADLGVSSHHFDEESRGFSFRFNANLDMRMNQQGNLTAEKVINDYEDEKLYSIFRQYGEVNNVGKLVKLILDARTGRRIKTIAQLKEAIESAIPKKMEHKYLAQVFQALRIEVNQEMEALKEMIMQCEHILVKGGRFSVITYHSLEDRLVKNYMKNGMFDGQPEKDLYGNIKVPFSAVNRKVIVPNTEELERNNRSRSAKLRIAEKI